MRTLDELLSVDDPAWPHVQDLLRSSSRSVEIVPGNRVLGEAALLHLQISVGSTLGAIIVETGGIFLDHGWLRFLGAGGENRMRHDIYIWNSLTAGGPAAIDGALIVALDAIGGFFAINSGVFPGKPGSIYYMAPDTLRWEDLSIGYTQLVQWAVKGEMPKFYESMRWPGWETEVSTLTGDHGFFIYPPLWTNPTLSIAERSRRIIPITELWKFEQEMARRTEGLKDGASITVKVVED